ncbi:ferrochelatase [Paenibacillus filicis]|uniref:Ferrochelatase n=1 Tax=Paenibacillus filicis TaxID=669464 RepID=A0ABU9DEG1_9BACL
MKAVLMLSYASLNSIDDLPGFYTHLFHGQTPLPEILQEAVIRFRSIGTADPLGSVTGRQAAALEKRLNAWTGNNIRVYQATKHTPPFIEDTIRQIIVDGATRLFILPASPLYSRTGTAAYHQRVRKALAANGVTLPVVEVNHWHRFPGISDAIALRLRTAVQWLSSASRDQATVIFTAHSQPGLPEANKEFIQAFFELAQAVAGQADCRRWLLAYRSAGPATQKWLGPDVLQMIETVALEGGKAVILCDLLSLTENVEAVFDGKINCRLKAEACGLEFVAAEFLNDAADYIDALTALIRERIEQTDSVYPM